MQPASIQRVRASFVELAPRADGLVDTFYSSLFQQHPELRGLFPPDAAMGRQKHHLIAALALVCKNIDCLDILEEPLMNLGAQHVGYGALPEHYPWVRDLLLAAIEKTAGPSFTPQLRADWFEALNSVCNIMLKGAARAALDVAQTMSGAPAQGRPGRATA